MTLDHNGYSHICLEPNAAIVHPVEVCPMACKPRRVKEADIDIQALSQRIASSIDRMGYTQARFADLMEVDQGTVSNWRTGKKGVPKGATLIAMADLLGVSLDWLLTGKGTPSGTPQTPYERACEAFVLLATDPAKARQFVASQANLYSQHTDRLTAEDHLGFLRVSYPRWVAGTEDELPPGTKFRAPRELHEINPRPAKKAAKK